MRKLTAAIACRNTGVRLYGKPIQNLDIEKNITVLDNLLSCISSIECIDEICLGISNGKENEIYKDIAEQKGIKFIVGDEVDVLDRLIKCGKKTEATDIFRVTSECPFLWYDEIESAWKVHCNKNSDYTSYDDLIDGIGFSFTSMEAFLKSHEKGSTEHRSELCHLYIRENMNEFKTTILDTPKNFIRKDLRLTVDYPEDLVLCRAIYNEFKHLAPRIPIESIVSFLDENPKLIKLVQPFTEAGYATMC